MLELLQLLCEHCYVVCLLTTKGSSSGVVDIGGQKKYLSISLLDKMGVDTTTETRCTTNVVNVVYVMCRCQSVGWD